MDDFDLREEKLSMSDLPYAFQQLLPEQVQDCLCIYKAEVKAFAAAK